MPLPRVIADFPLPESILSLLQDKVELLPWQLAIDGTDQPVDALYTYGHPAVDGPLLDRLTGLKLISNCGVGVDHIDLTATRERNLPVGNTPGILNGATGDMAFALLLAAGRRLAEGDRYARSPQFTTFDPGYMLGREIHGTTLGIIGMGSIGEQIARRAAGFDMQIVYHNRNRREDAEARTDARYVGFDELLTTSDYVVIVVPLTDETYQLIGREQFALMKSSAIFVNIARGGVVDTDALTDALQNGTIYAAGVDVTDPEPLPRDHPLLACDNLTLCPHLGSATKQTRQRMADVSVENLLNGLAGRELVHRVV